MIVLGRFNQIPRLWNRTNSGPTGALTFETPQPVKNRLPKPAFFSTPLDEVIWLTPSTPSGIALLYGIEDSSHPLRHFGVQRPRSSATPFFNSAQRVAEFFRCSPSFFTLLGYGPQREKGFWPRSSIAVIKTPDYTPSFSGPPRP